MSKKFKIKKGDQVVVTTGRDKGKKGEVLRVLRDEDRAVVQGINVAKKHQRATQTSAGGIVENEASIHISNIALVDPKSGDATRVGYRQDGDRKVRFAKKSGEVVDV
ncbi:50S ribosomal protein L24 [Kiloniella laminariae]|uniref:Large ribosomal subunit protein uL24 n=1 Tax=Kiloniella laminariae TaxID=454162 RepID=A0ABT4LRP8_9PROT|nr:50S ribosomal protein L24 [Kiloniella laminariae]MCZ4283006.1 50S ribosomal protein L24 [Kiloniella laminariae]